MNSVENLEIQYAPDLATGYMRNGTNNRNEWLTPIQAVLRTPDGDYFLSKECRAEQILSDFSGRCFNRFYEFLVIKSPDKAIVHRAGVNIPLLDRVLKLKPRSEESGLKCEAICGQKKIKVLNFADALNDLVLGRTSSSEFFLKISWDRYELFCPAHYINYPNLNLCDNRYIQPISGPVIFPGTGGKIKTAYVVAHMRGDSMSHIEFVLRENINPYKIARAVHSNPIWQMLFSISLVRIDDYSESVVVKGVAGLFKYI